MNAHAAEESVASRALERLAWAYWQPLYVFLRQRGTGHDQASDAVQGFFEHLLDREMLKNVTQRETRFRTFLLTCFTRWHSNQTRDRSTQRRGGGVEPVPLEQITVLEAGLVLDGEAATDRFDHQWARNLYERALARLDEEISAQGERSSFLVELRRRMLGPDALAADWEPVAVQFGMAVGAVRKAAHDLRRRFAALLRHEVRAVVADDAEVDDELRYLVRLLTASS